jgi:hypothetical protein
MESQGAPLTDTTSRQAICFINQVDSYDNVQVTVSNVSGCGKGANSTGTTVAGPSPVPVQLIT